MMSDGLAYRHDYHEQPPRVEYGLTELGTKMLPIVNSLADFGNYYKSTIGKENRIELHEKLSLTGAEISLNELPAGANVPFVHSHKENEEIYGILSGNGKAIIDGEEISLSTGDWLKIAPAAKRQFFASDISGITYICIQVKENSLEHFTAEDAVIG